MTKKQYACILKAKEVISAIQTLSIYGQEACENYDTAYYKLCDIEDMCDSWLADFCDVDPNWKPTKM